MRVKFRFVLHRAPFIACLLVAFSFTGLHAKSIRLRNPVVPEKSAAKSAAITGKFTGNVPGSGLYLIQFREALTPASRDQLSAAGIELLRYVPDDAFIG